jgi:hypothetical protein
MKSEQIEGGSSSPLLDVKINGPLAPNSASRGGATDPPIDRDAFVARTVLSRQRFENKIRWISEVEGALAERATANGPRSVPQMKIDI